VELVDGHVDLWSRKAVRGSQVAALSAREVALLQYLSARPRRFFTRSELHVEAFGFHAAVKSRAADVVVRRLRMKIEPDPAQPVLLLSERGAGWCFVPPTRRIAARPPVAAPPELVGREDVLAELRDLLAAGHTVHLTGPPGIGKTAVLRVLAGPDAVVVDGCADLTAACKQAGEAHFGVATPSLSALAEASGGGALWVDHAGNHTVVGPTGTLVASRGRADVPGARRVELPPLDAEAARALFDLRGGRDGPAVPSLLARLDGLPLAIELAAAASRLLGLQALTGQTQGLAVWLSAVHDADPLTASVRAMCEHLDRDERGVLKVLTVFGDPVSVELAVDVCAAALDAAAPATRWLRHLGTLRGRSLVQLRDDALHLLQPVRDVVQSLMSPAWTATVQRAHEGVLLDHVAPLTSGWTGPGHRGHARELAPLAGQLERVETATRFRAPDRSARATLALVGHRAQTLSLLDQASRIHAALALPDVDGSVRDHLEMELLDLELGAGRIDAARERLASSQLDLHRHPLGRLLLASFAASDGSLTEADAHVSAAVRVSRSTDNPRLLGRALLFRAAVALMRGSWDDAVAAASEAVSTAEGAGDLVTLVRAHRALAQSRSRADDHVAAVQSSGRAVALARTLGAVVALERALTGHANRLAALGSMAEAIAVDLEARQLALRRRDEGGAAMTTANLALFYDLAGDAESARAMLDETERLARSPGFLAGSWVSIHLGRGGLEASEGDLHAAAATLARATAERFDPRMAWCHVAAGALRAAVLAELGDHDDADACLGAAHARATSVGDATSRQIVETTELHLAILRGREDPSEGWRHLAVDAPRMPELARTRLRLREMLARLTG
jgi:tetratricopeptide (TPR) repeat protein